MFQLWGDLNFILAQIDIMDGNKTLVLERKQKIDDLMKIKEVKMKDQTEFIRKANEILSKRV